MKVDYLEADLFEPRGHTYEEMRDFRTKGALHHSLYVEMKRELILDGHHSLGKASDRAN